MKKFLHLLFILLVAFLLTACGSNNSNGDASGGTLTIYIASPEEYAIATVNKFEEETGIDVDMVRMSAGEVLAKVRSEGNNPQADVWFGGGADTFEIAKEEGLLHSYQSPVAEDIPEEYKDPDGYWTGVYLSAMGFATNQNFLDEHGLEPPTSWDDLLDPVYTNQIVMPHPSSSGTAYAILENIIRAKGGEEEGFTYLEKLHPQIQQYTTSGAAPGRMVGLGEIGAGILWDSNIIRLQEEGFEDIVLSFPEDGVGVEVAATGIIEGSRNEELAQEFIDWASGPGAQEIGASVNQFMNPTHPDAASHEKTVDLDDLNIITPDPKESGENRQGVIDRWDNEVNN